MASGDAVQQIKDRLNILDVVGETVELHRAGKHFKGRCPFHNEKSPSFHVSPERGTYHCFGCGVGGDIFSFVQAIDGVEFKEALKTLAQKAGVELVPEAPEKRGLREQLIAVTEAATVFFAEKLPYCTEAVAYLEKRGVSKETIAKWRIGYAPGPPTGGWRELKSHLNSIGYTDDIILKAGLAKPADVGKEPFDLFRDRIMFPLRDASGKVVAFSGRILHPDEKSPKYVNSPETDLFHKSDVLYGYDFAKHNIRQLPFWLLVEGQFDVVMSHQAGYTTTVAVSGTALTLHHVQLLERLSKNVVLALDADKAGINAMKKAADLMLRRGMDVKVAVLPDGADPADLVLADAKAFKVTVGNSIHVIEYLLQHLRRGIADDRAYKLRVREEVLPFVTLIPNHIDRDHFEGVIASALGTSTEAVHMEVVRLEKRDAALPSEQTEETPIAAPRASGSLDRHAKAGAYLVACMRVVSPAEALVIERVLTSVRNQPLADIVAEMDERIISELTFSLESAFEHMSAKVRQSELLHKLNQYRESYLTDAQQKERAAIQNDGGEADVARLARIVELTKARQVPAYTEVLFE
ncbi:MAG: primase, primase protein [Candidatus Parcubacteria bacterium]|jgi:DNA primase